MAAENTAADSTPDVDDDPSSGPEVSCDRLRHLTTGDLARACDTTVRTVRFYEEAGVLCPETRSEGGHRLFGKDNLAKLQLIMDLREAGLSLNDIRALFELKREHPSPEKASLAMQQVLEGQIDEMQRKIAVLRRLREELAQTVAIIQECQGCESRSFPKNCCDCDVMNRGDLPRAMRLLWGCE
ncbi:MAG: MerR family transcriptional regulator [Sandaracinaceae bacterium]|nr:MerR family transcriptional regulator [Myxococcales bacterium]